MRWWEWDDEQGVGIAGTGKNSGMVGMQMVGMQMVGMGWRTGGKNGGNGKMRMGQT